MPGLSRQPAASLVASLHRGASEQDVIRLHFGLTGQYRVHYPQLQRSYEHLQPHYSLFYARPFELEFVTSLPQALEHSIRCLLESRYAGALEQTYLLSQSLELLVRVLDYGSRAAEPRASFVKGRSDRDKLHAARDLIDVSLSDPPTLLQLGKRVGLNEYKLKRGFKELFGTTVFSYLAGQRLELAMQMLRDTDRSAAQVAFALGYKTPQHFGEAFKRRFGITPKAVRKNP